MIKELLQLVINEIEQSVDETKKNEIRILCDAIQVLIEKGHRVEIEKVVEKIVEVPAERDPNLLTISEYNNYLVESLRESNLVIDDKINRSFRINSKDYNTVKEFYGTYQRFVELVTRVFAESIRKRKK